MHHNNNCIGPFILIIPMLGFFALGFVIWLAIALVRTPRAPTASGAPVALSNVVAEAILRSQLARGGAACTAGFVATAAGIAFDAAGWSVVLAIASVFMLRGVVLRREALGRLAHPDTAAQRLGNWIILTHHAGVTHVEVSARAFAVAERPAVPTATARPR